MRTQTEPIDIPDRDALRAWRRFRRWILREFPTTVRLVNMGLVTARAKHGWIIVWSVGPSQPSAKDLHHEAMEYASRAYILRHTNGAEEERRRLSREAWRLEREAAMVFASTPGPLVEPTRSVLFRSAACLAVDAGERWTPRPAPRKPPSRAPRASPPRT